MLGEAVQKLLKEEINRLNIGLPDTVFQFQIEFNQEAAKKYLRDNPEVPFIIHFASLDNYFSLVIPDLDSKGFRTQLIAPPKQDGEAFKVLGSDYGLNEYLNKYCNPLLTKKFKPFLTPKNIYEVEQLIMDEEGCLYNAYHYDKGREKIIDGLEKLLTLNGKVEKLDEAIKIIEADCPNFLMGAFSEVGRLMSKFDYQQRLFEKKFKPFLTPKNRYEVEQLIMDEEGRLYNAYHHDKGREKIIDGLEKLLTLNGKVEKLDEAIKIIEADCPNFLMGAFSEVGRLMSKFDYQQGCSAKKINAFFVQDDINNELITEKKEKEQETTRKDMGYMS